MKANLIELLKITVASLSVLTALGCSPEGQTARSIELASPDATTTIVNGRIVTADDVISKSTVALYLKFPDSTRVENFCTATIIASDTLVTAAHCLADVAKMFDLTVDQLLPNLRIGLGLKLVKSIDDSRTQWIELKSATVHPDYVMAEDALEKAGNGVAFYDIAIIRLNSSIPAGYKAAKLLDSPARLVAGLKLVLAGYGVTRGAPFPIASNELRKTEVTVDNAALNPVQFAYKVTNGQTACSGDSGGPAYMVEGNQLTLVGATSWGDGPCVQQGVYTSIPAMYDWIQQTIH
ncbi:MAG: S1 family peptidase [Bdellovibrio sp.]